MNKRIYAFRGATCTKDDEVSIIENVSNLYTEMIRINNLQEDDIVSIQFTTTPDIHTLNPAAALRKKGYANSIPLFCSLEPVFNNSLEFVIRCMITAYSEKSNVSVYINGAQVLRPDLSNLTENSRK